MSTRSESQYSLLTKMVLGMKDTRDAAGASGEAESSEESEPTVSYESPDRFVIVDMGIGKSLSDVWEDV